MALKQTENWFLFKTNQKQTMNHSFKCLFWYFTLSC